MRGKAFGIVQPRHGIDQPSKPWDKLAAGRRQSVLAQLSGVAAVPQVESRLQDLLHLEAPGTVGMIFLQMLAAPQQVLLMPISA